MISQILECTYNIPPKRTIEEVEAMGKDKIIEESINLAPGGEAARYVQYIKRFIFWLHFVFALFKTYIDRWYAGYTITMTDMKEIAPELEKEGSY
jgi:hypothetical protein